MKRWILFTAFIVALIVQSPAQSWFDSGGINDYSFTVDNNNDYDVESSSFTVDWVDDYSYGWTGYSQYEPVISYEGWSPTSGGDMFQFSNINTISDEYYVDRIGAYSIITPATSNDFKLVTEGRYRLDIGEW